LEDVGIADRVIMLALGQIIKDTTIEDFKKISKNKDMGEAFRILSNQKKGTK
jgi:ABC-type Na+ transport system ATPase subunit NatA